SPRADNRESLDIRRARPSLWNQATKTTELSADSQRPCAPLYAGRPPTWKSALKWIHFGGEITSHAQPARKQRPPSGVIAPSARIFVSPIAYKLPLKIMIPAKSSHHAPRFVDPTSASAKSAIA